MTAIKIQPLLVPLHVDDTGTIRVSGTRVTLDVVLDLYDEYRSAEAIVNALDVLDLADVHAVLAWSLRHAQEMTAYRERRDREAEEMERQFEAAGIAIPGAELNAKLLARQSGPEGNHVPPGS